MGREYVAKSPHRRPCDGCGTPILPGDRVRTWCWMDPDGIGGNIMRLHVPCTEAVDELGIEEFVPGDALAGHDEYRRQALRLVESERVAALPAHVRAALEYASACAFHPQDADRPAELSRLLDAFVKALNAHDHENWFPERVTPPGGAS